MKNRTCVNNIHIISSRFSILLLNLLSRSFESRTLESRKSYCTNNLDVHKPYKSDNCQRLGSVFNEVTISIRCTSIAKHQRSFLCSKNSVVMETLVSSPGRLKRCYSYDDRSIATNSYHILQYQAMLDLYNVTCDKKAYYMERIKTTTIEDLEKNIAQSGPRNYSQLLSGSYPEFYCTISFESGSRKTRFDCRASPKSCLFYREFGSMRFLTALITFSPKENINDLFSEGKIEFAGLKYIFFGGEVNDGKSAKRGNGLQFTAWFFAEQDYIDATDLSVKELRDWTGNFGNQSALKINCRLSLGFSPSTPYFSLQDSDVSVIDDIVNQDGKLMTDGCGYISVSLSQTSPLLSQEILSSLIQNNCLNCLIFYGNLLQLKG